MDSFVILNSSMELADYHDKWCFNGEYNCWCLENISYTPTAKVPECQLLSIFVPRELINADGSFATQAKSVPVVFENNAAGFAQMPNVRLGEPRCYAQQYLEHGLIYVTCGCRGRNSVDTAGKLAGKGPSSLVDLKTAIRFLRHNRDALPGDWDRIISVGWSAGGAMSALLAVTGDNACYTPYLAENGAFTDESDAVFAAQIYCPIVDLEHADIAYEWMFRADKTSENFHSGKAEVMTPFKEALSAVLAQRYVEYVNSLGLKNPKTDELLQLDNGGRSGSFYEYLMSCLSDSATDYLTRLKLGESPCDFSPESYLSDICGAADCHSWLEWDGNRARISDLDAYVLNHRRRMKPCTSFDKLEMDSAENQAFGTPENDYMHYNLEIAAAIAELKDRFPLEFEKYHDAYAAARHDEKLAERVKLLNPMSFIGTAEKSKQAKHYRIRVGACDADTSLSISMTLALSLANSGCGTVDYALVWAQPHTEADYPGEVCQWIDSIIAR